MFQTTVRKKEFKRKVKKFSVILKEDDTNQCSYKIDRRVFDTLKKYLEPFRSFQTKAKKIRCVETGQVFNSAREASHWVEFVRETNYCDMNLIKQCCKGKQKTSYGYHWEFVEVQDSNVA